MNKLIIALYLMSQTMYAVADGRSDCDAAAGEFLSASVVSAPKFARAKQTIKGIKLSHTHINVRPDGDSRVYDVAMSNVYARDYVRNANNIPKSLAALRTGDKLELCGKLYTSGLGIHWVHSNCNITPDAEHPDGSVKKVLADGSTGENLQSSQAYCYLWN
ncbi:hypothetical protein [Janthinobacterium fluminis]|uniref:DUF3465 domain-containing protein n=1 Tax=Janthinobacterium fluminis TaxID=2987524 RepID=A0ABT5JTD7_9BURK|nr:hypothetical protein [Janthinobacterium fluminis]MDC8756016.1 hypothetical protein [Janthinobacterium fluminis]